MAGKAPVHVDVKEGSVISPLAKDRLEQFKNLFALLQNLDKSVGTGFDLDSTRLAVEDARARYKAWGLSIAAFHDEKLRTSLDFRLNEAPGIRGRTLQVLRDLQEYLNEATSIVVGDKVNNSWSLDNMSDSSDDSEVDSQHEDNIQNEDGLRDKDDSHGEGVTSDLEELLKAIAASNSSLMKLSIVIRSSATRDDYFKVASRYKTWNPYPDIGHVREKYGYAKYSENWLLERLGKAITRRRQFFKYRVEHHGKMAGMWDDDEVQKNPEKTIVASTKATTFIGNGNIVQNVKTAGSDMGNSFGSQTSYDPTVFGNDGAPAMLTVPLPPKMAFPDVPFEYGEPFQCPYCFIEQVVKNKAAWKKHVFRDLKPYVCTFDGCEMLMFQSRNEWFAHEMQNHRKEWICQFCEHIPFATVSAFSKHTKSTHAAVLASSPLEALILQSEERVDRIPSTACHLCDDWEADLKRKQANRSSILDSEGDDSYGKPKQFRKHLGRHMEQLALFTLPLNHGGVDLENESSDEGDEGDSEPSVKPAVGASIPIVDSDQGSENTDETSDEVRNLLNPPTHLGNLEGAVSEREIGDKKSQGQIMQEDIERVAIQESSNPNPAPTNLEGEVMTRDNEVLNKFKLLEAEKAAQAKKDKGERDMEYQERLVNDLRNCGMDDMQINLVLNKEKEANPNRAPYTRMSRKYLSIETLNQYRLDYELDDLDPDFVLIKRWVPEHEQDFLWSHTKEIRERRRDKSPPRQAPQFIVNSCTECYRRKQKCIPQGDGPCTNCIRRFPPVKCSIDRTSNPMFNPEKKRNAAEQSGLHSTSTPNSQSSNLDPLDSLIDFSEYEQVSILNQPSDNYDPHSPQPAQDSQQKPTDRFYESGVPYDPPDYNTIESGSPSRRDRIFEPNQPASSEPSDHLWPGMHQQQAALAEARAQQKEQLRIIEQQTQASLKEDGKVGTADAAKIPENLARDKPSSVAGGFERILRQEIEMERLKREADAAATGLGMRDQELAESASPYASASQPRLSPSPSPIRAPSIHAEAVAHYRHINHGFERDRLPTRPPPSGPPTQPYHNPSSGFWTSKSRSISKYIYIWTCCQCGCDGMNVETTENCIGYTSGGSCGHMRCDMCTCVAQKVRSSR